MQIAIIHSSEPTKPIARFVIPEGEPELAIRYQLPNGDQVSPLYIGWEHAGYSIREVVPFTVPEGKVAEGEPSYEVDGDTLVEVYAVTDAPGDA